ALLVIYLLMCVMFQSWLYPFVIMFTVPLATFGGFLGLAIVHAASVGDRYLPVQNMDVLTILGFVLLAGIVVNNAILIVAQAQNFLRNGDVGPDGEVIRMDARRAISRSVETRVRPIMMSMLTSVGGMLPLVLMPGSGSELYRGLGAVVVGGLFLSTIFTLLLVPVMLGPAFAITREGEARPAEVNACGASCRSPRSSPSAARSVPTTCRRNPTSPRPGPKPSPTRRPPPTSTSRPGGSSSKTRR